MTYEKIVSLINEQRQLIGEGIIERPVMKYGFSAEGEEMFRNGLEVNEYFKRFFETQLKEEMYETSCAV